MTDARLERLREIYESLPALDCKGLCWNSCGPIDMSEAERERITDLGVEIPLFTEERARRWAANERLYCPALKFGVGVDGGVGCSIYEARPLICRLWGMQESMLCPHGCQPSRVLTDVEGTLLLIEAMRAGGSGANDRDADAFTALLERPEVAELLPALIDGNTADREDAMHQLATFMGLDR